MIVVLLAIVALSMTLGFIFKRWVLFILAGFASAGSGIIQVSTYTTATAGWLLGWVLLALALFCIVESFIIQSKVAQESYEKEMEDRGPILSEEEAYSELLDGEIGESAEAQATRKAKAVRRKYRAMMDR